MQKIDEIREKIKRIQDYRKEISSNYALNDLIVNKKGTDFIGNKDIININAEGTNTTISNAFIHLKYKQSHTSKTVTNLPNNYIIQKTPNWDFNDELKFLEGDVLNLEGWFLYLLVKINNSIIFINSIVFLEFDIKPYKLTSYKINEIKKELYQPHRRGRQPSSPDSEKKRSIFIEKIENEYKKLIDYLEHIETQLQTNEHNINENIKEMRRKAIEDTNRENSLSKGILTQEDKDNVNKINAVVCYKILERYSLLDANNKAIKPIPNDKTHLLNGQTKILFDIVNGKNISKLDEQILDVFHKRFIDKNLNNRFTKSQIKDLLITSKSKNDNKKFVINNFARWSGFLNNLEPKSYYYCPITSIIDKQPSCTLKTALKDIPPDILEYPDKRLAFKILNKTDKDSEYYEAIINHNNSKKKSTVAVTIVTPEQYTIHINRDIDLETGKEFAARTVYKDLIKIILSQWMKDPVKYLNGDPDSDKIDPNIKSISDFWNKLKTNISFNELIKVSPIKNFGDLFQELSVVLKNGGMDTPKYEPNNNKIIKYNRNGNAIRVGLMGDRPSGVRLVVLLANAKGDINENAAGGYIGDGGGNSGLEETDKRYNGPLFIERNNSNKPLL